MPVSPEIHMLKSKPPIVMISGGGVSGGIGGDVK